MEREENGGWGLPTNIFVVLYTLAIKTDYMYISEFFSLILSAKIPLISHLLYRSIQMCACVIGTVLPKTAYLLSTFHYLENVYHIIQHYRKSYYIVLYLTCPNWCMLEKCLPPPTSLSNPNQVVERSASWVLQTYMSLSRERGGLGEIVGDDDPRQASL